MAEESQESSSLANAKIIELSGIKTKEDFRKWLKTFYEETGQSFRIRWSSAGDTPLVLYRASLVCLHNTLPEKSGSKRPAKKHTGCPVEMKVHIRIVRLTADIICRIEIYGKHNHPLKVVKYNRVSDTTKDKFIELFKAGYTPLQALQVHKQNMMEKYGGDYLNQIDDRALCPDLNWVYKLFAKEFKTKSTEDSIEKVLEVLSYYVEKLGKGGHKMQVGQVENDVFVVLVTDLAERVHLLESSGQLAFFVSLGTMDVAKKFCVYVIMANSIVGGLPLGFFLLGSDSVQLKIEALLAYKRLLLDDSFGGRGQEGPEIFIVDNCKSTDEALRAVFPNSVLLMGIFYVFESIWMWLWRGNHKIESEDRKELFRAAVALLHCKSSDELELAFQSCVNSDTAKKHPTYAVHLRKLYESSDKWALGFHEEFQIREVGDVTEISCQVLRDRIFFQVRVYTVDRLMDFLIHNLNKYYQRKIVFIMNEQYDEFLQLTYCGVEPIDLVVTEIDTGMFQVTSTDGVPCEVAYFIGRCECAVGAYGGPCKHQFVVALFENETKASKFPTSSEDRKILCWTATGFFTEDSDVYRNLMSSKSQVKMLEIVDAVPEVAHEIDLEMEMATEEDSAIVKKDSKADHVNMMLSDITSTIMNQLKDADESFYQALEKFYDSFKHASTTPSTIQEFFHRFDRIDDKSNTIILVQSQVPVVNFSLPVINNVLIAPLKCPVPALTTVGGAMKNEIGDQGSISVKRIHIDEHGYAAPLKQKK